MLRYQVNRLLWRNNVVCAFRSNSLTSCRGHDCIVNDWMNSAREQNPFIFCQILEREVFFLDSRVALWKSRIERRQNEWRGLDLRVLRRCRHQGQVHFAC